MPQYFGFFGNASDQWGDSISESYSYTNLHWVDGCDTNKIIRARAMGAKVIINAIPYVFAYPTTNTSELRPNLQAWWMVLSPELQATVVAFLVADEPFRANDKHYHLTDDDLNYRLNSAAQWLKSFTGKAMCICASGPEFDKWGVPASFDWIGMYRYSYNTHWTQLGYSFINLMRKLRAHQSMVAVMDAYADVNHPINESRIKSFNSWWQSYIGWYGSRVVAVAPFLYQSPKMGDLPVYGATSMPRVLADLQSYALKITRGAVA